MHKLQIQLLHFHYGWTVKAIGKHLDLPEVAVRMYIEELTAEGEKLEAAGIEVLPPEDADPNLPATKSEDSLTSAYNTGLNNLKTKEVNKQQILAPIIASIELSLLQKVKEAADTCGDSPAQLAMVVDTFKKLTKDSIINTIVKTDTKDGNKNGPQVAVQIMQFRD